MNDNPTKACNGCGIPVELAALQVGGFCPNCASPTDNGWEVDREPDLGVVTHLLDVSLELNGGVGTCEIMVTDEHPSHAVVVWDLFVQLDSTGAASEPSVHTAKMEALRKAIETLQQLTIKLEATYEREASN